MKKFYSIILHKKFFFDYFHLVSRSILYNNKKDKDITENRKVSKLRFEKYRNITFFLASTIPGCQKD